MVGISQEDGAMTYAARVPILALFVMLTAALGAYLINSILIVAEALYALPRATLYSPLASLITNLIASSAIPDAAVQARFAVSREFTLINSAIFMCLIILSSIFAFIMRNPKGIFTAISCSLFVVVPGIAISRVWAPIYYSYRAPDVHWAFLDLQSTLLQIGLSVAFYALLFFAGALILTDGQPRAAGAR
jgi:hypothetical protein